MSFKAAAAAPSVEMIEDPTDLRRRVRVTGTGALDEAVIARAEAALEALSGNFTDWMHQETEKLSRARDALRGHGRDEHKLGALYRAAHDLRGEAATLGFPVAGRIAAGLSELVEAAESTPLPFEIASHHVDAIRAIVREGKEGPTADAVAQALAEAVRRHHAGTEARTPVDDHGARS